MERVGCLLLVMMESQELNVLSLLNYKPRQYIWNNGDSEQQAVQGRGPQKKRNRGRRPGTALFTCLKRAQAVVPWSDPQTEPRTPLS